MNILFTCAGRRNYLINYFKAAIGNQGKIYAADMQLTAPAMVAADRAFKVPSIYSNDYVDVILNICKQESIAALISLNDLELPILANNKHLFEVIGTRVIVSSENVINICFDKWETMRYAQSIGINCPKTYLNLDSAKEAIELGELQFPLVIKPRWGSASIGIEFSETSEELETAYKLLRLKLRKTILFEASSEDFENAILIQEKIDGIEYGVDLLNDFEGNNICVYVKEKLAMRAGETDKAVLRNMPELETISKRLANNIKHIGNMDCDFFYSDGVFYLLELNPRFGGGYPFTQVSGGNFPAIILSILKGEEISANDLKKEYNKIYSKCDILVSVGSVL